MEAHGLRGSAVSTIKEKAEQFAAGVHVDFGDPEVDAVVRRAMAHAWEKGYAEAAGDSARSFQMSLGPAIQQQRAEAWDEAAKATAYEYIQEHGVPLDPLPNPYEEQA